MLKLVNRKLLGLIVTYFATLLTVDNGPFCLYKVSIMHLYNEADTMEVNGSINKH